jgi:hypothetical protein
MFWRWSYVSRGLNRFPQLQPPPLGVSSWSRRRPTGITIARTTAMWRRGRSTHLSQCPKELIAAPHTFLAHASGRWSRAREQAHSAVLRRARGSSVRPEVRAGARSNQSHSGACASVNSARTALVKNRRVGTLGVSLRTARERELAVQEHMRRHAAALRRRRPPGAR